jgi:hypothetical protein
MMGTAPMHTLRSVSAAFLGILTCMLLTGCSTSAPKKEEPPPEPVTGLHALAQMFSAARTWQTDVMVLRVSSFNSGNAATPPGRAPAWLATFVSQSTHQSRTYTFAVADISTSVRQGTFPDPPVPYSDSGQNAQPFIIAAAKHDTDEAFTTAFEHAADYISKHPGLQINYLLELNNRWPDATWRVIWGETASSGFSVLVDATTGKFARVLD